MNNNKRREYYICVELFFWLTLFMFVIFCRQSIKPSSFVGTSSSGNKSLLALVSLLVVGVKTLFVFWMFWLVALEDALDWSELNALCRKTCWSCTGSDDDRRVLKS